MRQLATLTDADAARALADYLLTLKIDTQLDKQPDGWAIWVRDEDHLLRARQELQEYQRHPDDPRYQAAGSTADALRRQRLREEKAYQRRQKRIYARMDRAGTAGSCTLALIVISALVLVVKDGTSYGRLLVRELSIAPFEYVLVSARNVPDDFLDEDSFVWKLRSPGLEPILHGEVWRLVTPIFLHFGIWHLVFNMWWLYVLGGAIEWRRGQVRYLSMVVVLAVVSNLAQYFLGQLGATESIASLPRSPNFGGMSGVVYGLFGYVWMKGRFQPEMGLGIDRANIVIMIGWLLLCMTPFSTALVGGRVANVAHVAGLLAGMLIGYVPIVWQANRSA